MSKRTIDSFFSRDPKKKRVATDIVEEQTSYSHHHTYPFPIRNLPRSTLNELKSLPFSPGRQINNQPDLDLLYFKPYIPPPLAKQLFNFLRSELPFYRVEYIIKRGGTETNIKTPRFTTVFGIDETSLFNPDHDDNAATILEAKTHQPYPNNINPYDRYNPRPIPQCLDQLRKSTESATGYKFNFCLVNYYASGADSISFHSDDERFLGPEPAIASFSLGASRDFLMKHKPTAPSGPPHPPQQQKQPQSLKLPLTSGDMILMRGKTQANWLHSIPKRTGKQQQHDGGRINITFRRAMVKGGTDNYYNYNVGKGPVFKWDEVAKEMKEWKTPKQQENHIQSQEQKDERKPVTT
ncbi:putative alpha-ketoglutarate-dependent dioxygenase [Podospora fimiseda]|uniref:Alpha-ketoglutarate-dependent dioxygenase n=1 Tax=Podospora fimiseda TaxID=252190 RepID=A0AAN7BWN2_9PEZI|nr:putative alpha-ketoglutarate-dependent dioxygenase [Podospora fimiseda]